MGKIKLLIIHPIDEAIKKFGGVETTIQTYLTYAPDNFDFRIIGITGRNSGLKLGKWHSLIFNGKRIKFFPVLKVNDPNKRSVIPLTFRFCFGLLRWRHKVNFKNAVLIFHRLEPNYALRDIKEKKVLFVHGNIRYFDNKYCESKWRKIRKLYYFLEPFFIKQMERIFVVSQAGCKYYKKRYPKYSSRFMFLPMWYDPKVFNKMEHIDKHKVLHHWGIPGGEPLILFVGRLELAKDPFLLIESFSLINKTYPDSHLIIIGEGQLKRKIFQQINELNLVGKVSLLERKTSTELAHLMNICDLMLLTSAFEGMPMVVLESLACGLPVVATNVGENYLIVKDKVSGKLVSSREPKDIANAAVKILSSPPSASSCQKAVSFYSQENVLSFLYSEFRKVQNEQI